MDKKDISTKLERLRRLDPGFKLFGSKLHQYLLRPVLTDEEVVTVERQHRFVLPADYRRFITEIGNGGAGPNYGIFPLGYQHGLRKLEKWYSLGDLQGPFPHTSSWNLPPEFWSQAPNPRPGTPTEEEDRKNAEWDKKVDQTYWLTSLVDGAIPISDEGCALTSILVVTGPQAGEIWHDHRADFHGIAPMTGIDGQHLTFSDWYMSWLDRCLTKLA